MNYKKTLPTLALALVMLFTVSAAFAQPKEKAAPPQAPPPPAAKISPEDQAAMKAMWKEHHLKVAPLGDQLWAKQMEYDALVANPNSKHEDIKALIEEMRKLRVEMRAEKTKFFEALEAKGYDRGPGRHWFGFDGDRRGPGYDHGPSKGRHRGPKGFGPEGRFPHHEGENLLTD